ncbi:transcriptional regulator, TetR family [Gemmobacter megaterium]|uniref:Transcriptional regulator, TetR family n=1 Tax=Gemmobacter megaterium TaxID=1086013 RepID=A0A1N7K289_9RHOB|nr:TetR/AcrR family transcriptional regulator [Gemmobacter megaterium]GGE00033.1 TetR family transcriptional regulator [Gemmobacter megaterium]SIS55677.1 transcriptional regulator, TetR family [Gemmobacter megaterium]
MTHLAPLDAQAQPPTPREAEILDAVRHVFAEKGFDGASMQELARAAGMSVGNFYRYFPSKAAMVEELIRHDLKDVEAHFARVASAPDPLATLRIALAERVRNYAEMCTDAPLRAEITAAALRKPELAIVVGRVEREITTYLVRAFGTATGLDFDTAWQRFAAHARLIVLLVKACTTRLRIGDVDGEALTVLILRQIDSLLDEVAAARPETSRT